MKTMRKIKAITATMLLCLSLTSVTALGQSKYDNKVKIKNGDYYAVKKNGKWGICDMNFHEIIVPKYDNLGTSMDGDFFRVEKNGKWGLCNKRGHEIIAPKYDGIAGVSVYDYYFVKLDDYYGVIDLTEKSIVPCEYDGINFVANKLFYIKKNQAEGLLDINGETIIPCEVKKLDYWEEDTDLSFIRVTTFDNLKGVYSTKGELIVPVTYSGVECFVYQEGGIRGFRVENEDGYYGYYTTDGKLLISPSMGIEDLSVLENHNYLIAFIGNREGLIDELGNFVVPVGMYYGFGETEDGSTIIGRKGGKCCEFYPNGKEKFVSEFVNFQEDENHQIVAKQGKEELFRKGANVYYRVYDNKGAVGVACNDRQIINCEYEKTICDPVANTYIYVYKDGYWGVYDCSGNLIIPVGKYHGFGIPEGKYDYFGVRKGSKWGVCGLDGKVIIEPDEYNGAAGNSESNGHIKVQKGNYLGMCDKKGNVVIEPVYTDIKTMTIKSKLIYVVKQGDKEGIIDTFGKTIIPPIFDCVDGYETPEFYSVTLNGKKGAYDREGNIIFAPEYNNLTYFLDEGFQYEDESGKWVSLNISIDDNGNAYYSYNSTYNEYFDKGESYFEDKDYKKAAKNYKKALEHKQTPDAYYNVGCCYYNMEKYDEAIDWFQQCLNCKPRPSLEELAQKLIDSSRQHIALNEQIEQIAAEAVDRVFKKNKEDALSILSAILTGNNNNSNPNPGGNMNYLLDPNYAAWQTQQKQAEMDAINQRLMNLSIQQTQQQEYKTYLLQTSGGSTMTFDDWKLISAQAAWNEANSMDYNGVSSDNSVNNDFEYKGKLSLDQYELHYRKWESIAQDYYRYLTDGGVRYQDSQGNIQGKTVGQLTGGVYTEWKQGLSKAQAEMKHLRQEAAQYGITIQQSQWETATAGY